VSDDDVVAWWRALGLPGLLDVHVHFLPPRMQRKVWAQFDAAGPLIGREWPIAYRTPEEDRVDRLRALGVRRFSALSYAHLPGMAEDLNDWADAFADRVPECLRSGTFYPEPGVEQYVEKRIGLGVEVFKVHVQVGAFDLRDPLLDPVWGLLAEAGTPVVVHAGSGPVPAEFTGPEPMRAVMRRHPRLTVVLAHMGAPEYEDFLAMAEDFERFHLDTTMAFTSFFEAEAPYPRELRPRLAALGDRVLLGSDFPSIPYPYAHQLEALEGLGLGEEWLRAVCWENGRRLFGDPS
jgi:predicted TIM-barrel fold metal-dependent hydrolase